MNKEHGFDWTFDQFQRYAAAQAALEFFFKEENPLVLDAGGLSPNRRGDDFWFPVREIAPRESWVLDIKYVKEQGFIQGDGVQLPVKDNRFDMVMALDVIEHIPPAKRKGMTEELCRVSRDLVLISAPENTKEVKEAEAMLLEQVWKLYRIIHVQLEEHRRYGLPETGEISGILKSSGFCEVDFSYGSLESWMFIQSLKHSFLFRPDLQTIHETIDWFAAQRLGEAELSPPFIRHFWVASKKRDEAQLKAGVKRIQTRLKKTNEKSSEDRQKEFERMRVFSRELTRAFFPEKVTAVVLAESGGEKLRDCLMHLLSQEVYFDLEVSVWNIGGNPDIESMMKTFFPQVTYLSWEANTPRGLREQMLELFCQLKGDYILLLGEEVLLPRDEVTRFYGKMKEGSEALLFVPENQCVFMRRDIFSKERCDEKIMQRKIRKMKKKDILSALCEAYKQIKVW